MLISSLFTFHYRAQNSPSLFTYYHSRWIRQCWSQHYAGRLSHLNPVKWSCSPWAHSSVNRAPVRCSRGHFFDSSRGLRFCLVPRSYQVDQFTFHIFTLSYYGYFFPVFAYLVLFRLQVSYISEKRRKFKINKRKRPITVEDSGKCTMKCAICFKTLSHLQIHCETEWNS